MGSILWPCLSFPPPPSRAGQLPGAFQPQVAEPVGCLCRPCPRGKGMGSCSGAGCDGRTHRLAALPPATSVPWLPTP